MNKKNDIVTLQTKLLIPRLPETIFRKRLNPVIEEMKTRRVVSVVAGAGYGKTTLVAQACRKLKTDTVWYRLSATDSDFVTFIHYLIAGIRKYYPDFGNTTLRRIESAQNIREREIILTFMLREIEESINRGFIIVLDDLHFIQDDPEIKETLAFLMKYLPDEVHLVLISRKTPDLNLSAYLARRETLLIDENALAFDTPEIASFYKTLFGISLQNYVLENLRIKTEGWVSGLILFHYSFKDLATEDIANRIDKLQGTSRTIFSYLEENVYALLSVETKDFLIKTSILSRLDISFCNRFLDIQHAGEILSELERKHLFTFPFDEQRSSWHYHNLFQDFLKEKTKIEMREEQIARLHALAGEIWEDFREPEEALNHYLEAGQYELACHRLNRMGQQFIREGRINLFFSYFNRIPDENKEREPWLYYTSGRALELHGRSLEASRAFERARVLFAGQGISKGVGLALNRLSFYYYILGDFQKAEAVLKEIVAGFRDMPRLYANALGNLIFVTSHLEKLEESDRYFEASIRLLEDMADRDLEAWVYMNHGFRCFTSGDLTEALALGQKGVRICRASANDDLLSYGYHLLSISSYYQGNCTEGFELALKGIKLGEEKGFRGINHAWHLINACCCGAAVGDIAPAVEYGEAGLKACREIESLWSEAWACLSLRIAWHKAGDLEKAEEYARTALALLEPLSLPGDRGMMQSALASILMEQGKTEDVEELLFRAESNFRGSKLNLSRVYLYLARYYREIQDYTESLNKLSACLALSEQYNYDYWIIDEKHWVSPLLKKIYSKGLFKDYLNKLFPKLGADDTENYNGLKSVPKNPEVIPPAGLRVYCFGKFRLFRGEEEIQAEDWKSEKARTLFQYLVYHRERGYLARDVLMEMLWPESDPEKSRKRLNVALTAIRKILEPDMARGAASAYLLRKGYGYRLNLGKDSFLDVAAFETELELAGKEKDENKVFEHYMRAEALYEGDFSQENNYMEWCAEARSIYREKYLQVLNYLLSALEKQGNPEKSVEYARKYLAIDRFAEDIYRSVMKLHFQTGKRHLVKKTYEEARQRLEHELDCPLSKETEDLYRKLISSE